MLFANEKVPTSRADRQAVEPTKWKQLSLALVSGGTSERTI